MPPSSHFRYLLLSWYCQVWARACSCERAEVEQQDWSSGDAPQPRCCQFRPHFLFCHSHGFFSFSCSAVHIVCLIVFPSSKPGNRLMFSGCSVSLVSSSAARVRSISISNGVSENCHIFHPISVSLTPCEFHDMFRLIYTWWQMRLVQTWAVTRVTTAEDSARVSLRCF